MRKKGRRHRVWRHGRVRCEISGLARMHHKFSSKAHPLFALSEGEKATLSRLVLLCYVVGGGVPTPRILRNATHAPRGEGTAPPGKAVEESRT